MLSPFHSLTFVSSDGAYGTEAARNVCLRDAPALTHKMIKALVNFAGECLADVHDFRRMTSGMTLSISSPDPAPESPQGTRALRAGRSHFRRWSYIVVKIDHV